jgi:phosphoglycerol transferase MdoB-like AlkP superfamily enzyme
MKNSISKQKITDKSVWKLPRTSIRKYLLKKTENISVENQIILERLRFGHLPTFVIFFLIMFFSVGIFYMIVYILSDLRQKGTTISLEIIVALILGVELFFILIQTVSIHRQTKYQRIDSLPIMHVFLKHNSDTSSFIIKLKNNGKDAINVRYIINTSYIIFTDIVKKSDEIFDLPPNDQIDLASFNDEDYQNKNLYIRIIYEDLFLERHLTVYKKIQNRTDLINISGSQ